MISRANKDNNRDGIWESPKFYTILLYHYEQIIIPLKVSKLIFSAIVKFNSGSGPRQRVEAYSNRQKHSMNVNKFLFIINFITNFNIFFFNSYNIKFAVNKFYPTLPLLFTVFVFAGHLQYVTPANNEGRSPVHTKGLHQHWDRFRFNTFDVKKMNIETHCNFFKYCQHFQITENCL